MATKTIIIGGGISGLCLAYHLVKRKHDVTLIDETSLGSKASTKAAGMITPASEVHLGEKTLMMCFLTATEYYDPFIADLTNSQPELVDYRKTGSFMCATNHDGHRDLLRLAEFQRSMGMDIKHLTRNEANELEPALSQRLVQAIFAKNEACIDNVKLISCLKNFLINSGHCTILENKKVTEIRWNNQTISKVVIGDRERIEIEADQFVLATGVDHGIEALKSEITLPIRPVKGQTIILKTPPDLIKRPIRVYHRYPIYLVPRADGRIVVGATSEELFDENVTAGGVMDLIYAAWQILPEIYDAPVLETKAGQRPATPDHKPVIGKTRFQNLYVLTGLYRHGIMAAPYLARELSFLICGEATEMNLAEFSPQRFASETHE